MHKKEFMGKREIKRFYIMPEVWVTVTQSQVFNWIKLVNENGISTDCISVTPTKSNQEIVERIENSIKGNFIEVHDFKRLLVNDLFLTLSLLKYYLKNIFKYKKIIFQTRMPKIGLTFAFLSWLPRLKLVFEARAAVNEERVYIGEGKKENLKTRIKNYFAETSEKQIVKKSDKVICVSNALKNYYIKKFELSNEKFVVFPGAADSELFYDDKVLRENTRKELDIQLNEILIVYSGRLDMKWEIPDKIILFFKDLHEKNKRFKLLLVTPDVDLAKKLIKEQKLEGQISVKKVELKNVNKYLNAADIGLLLREDIPMNNVASPTKFAEYVMTGLPVIISYGIHDFARNIKTTGYGVVVSGLENISSEEYENLLKALSIDRKQIANWGLEHLSKGTFIKTYVNILNEI